MSFLNRINYHALLLSALFLTASSVTGALNYTVAPTDTLYGLSRLYEVPLNWIIRANNLESEIIRPGQNIEIPVNGIHSLEVRPGDTLSALSMEFNVSQEELRRINNLDTESLKIGQQLKVPSPVPAGTYRVLPGDTLLAIAFHFGLTVDKLRMYNNMNGDVIHPAQLLIVKAPRPEGHEVGSGESLWTIAQRYGLAMSDLIDWNALAGNVIHPGEILALYPGLDRSGILPEPRIALAALPDRRPLKPENIPRPDIPRNGEYYFSYPVKKDQPNDSYWESPDAPAAVDYRRSRQVLELFQTETRTLPALSTALKGWHIVIDPGHGGLDPGAIVTVADGNGNPVVITEDEYAYDISMRLHRTLIRHGASVSMTILSPDHHIRNGVDARQTFVHRKNEVYNGASHNENAGWRPVGTIEGLDLRKTIAESEIRSTPSSQKHKGTLFISIHADNTPDLPAGTAVLFDGETDSEANRSRDLASALAPYLGSGSFIRRQPLRVLKNNPADAAVLVEARNINYASNAWALRSSELREQDALMIANGILAWAKSR